MGQFIELAVVEIDDNSIISAKECEALEKAAPDDAVYVLSHVHNAATGKRMGIKCRFDTVANMQVSLQEAFHELEISEKEIAWLHPAMDRVIVRSFDA